MSPAKPTLVIVHGAWHVPSHYSKFKVALQTEGYEVHIPRLPSVIEARPPNSDLATDTDLVRSYVESLNRSWARRDRPDAFVRRPGWHTNALYGFGHQHRPAHNGHLSHLTYMAGFALWESAGLIDIVKHFGQEHLVPLVDDFAEDSTMVNRDPRAFLIGPDSGLTEKKSWKYI